MSGFVVADPRHQRCAIGGFLRDRELVKEREILAQQQRVPGARFRKSFGPQDATVTVTAWLTFRSRVIAAMSQSVVEPECQAAANDLRLRQRDERGVNVKLFALDT